ncbi:MAG: non-ribosomal peptide synthetase [Candidatus Dormibacter sp.]
MRVTALRQRLTSLPAEDLARLVHELVAVQAELRPDALAVNAPDGVLTYGQLEARSNQLAHRLLALGVRRETLVGLCLERSAALVVGALGILKAGGAYVAIDPAYPDDRIDFMLADSDAVAVVTDAAGAARLAGRPGVVVVDAAEPLADPAPIPEVAVKGGDLAYVVYTSGSTGRPKGVTVEHASLLNLVGWHRRVFSIAAADRGMQFASPGFDAVVWEMWPYLTTGASVHVPSDSLRIDPAALRDWLVDQRITVCFVPTALAEEILSLAWPRDGSLRILLTGGDALHRRPGPDIPFTVVNNYGPAEATVVTTSGIIPASVGSEASPSLGRAIEGVSTHIVDDSLVPVPAGVAGELLIGGVGVARGYLNMPELTAERFIPDHLGDLAGGRLYRTGDLVRKRADGELDFLGRLDEQVMIRGRRIEPGEISATLDRHPSLRASAVVAIGDTPEQRRLVACVVAADGHSANTATLRAHLAAAMPDHMVPSDFVWFDKLPQLASGKVDRAALRTSLSALPRTAVGTAPRNELEEALTEIIAELLGIGAVGVEEDFFLLGGHSLLGAQMITRINDMFDVELPLRDLFEAPTVAALAAAVERLLVADLDRMSDEEAELLASGIAHGST